MSMSRLASARPSSSSLRTVPAAVLIVEDNVIIASDAEFTFRELGAQTVYAAGSSDEALRIVEGRRIDFALLDINLGDETSERVAVRLQEIGVPFAFASGYDEFDDLKEAFPEAPTVSKPYTHDTLAAAMSTRRQAGKDDPGPPA